MELYDSRVLAAMKVLELNGVLTEDVVRKAYRTAAKKWHPDKFVNSSEESIKAEEMMRKVNSARIVLMAELVTKSRGSRYLKHKSIFEFELNN
jgi:curved DNA-binding protein CbpA